ncbi:hypothetical protein [Niabella drilacis]|uniref:Uncharacterized protein n=1 Tax=Niabella drilacis (strain DSM 25811 / CCM 8410 / CCUG 62505 / LMG 26954 / E90) TaxID=1285928 RepID=A0A1G6PZD8_NIADE|nr:hypothetical protein [Niabella drilacis]SDC84896.1 hypothetical protein SAMN04487894_104202 [Niabella drilacis]
MKTLISILAVFFVTVTPLTVKSQFKINSDSAIRGFSGCYYAGNDEYGLLKLNPDRTFTWTREKTARGTWKMKKVFGIPFPAEIIILKYPTKKKERYEISEKTIYIGEKLYMSRVPCK